MADNYAELRAVIAKVDQDLYFFEGLTFDQATIIDTAPDLLAERDRLAGIVSNVRDLALALQATSSPTPDQSPDDEVPAAMQEERGRCAADLLAILAEGEKR